MSNSKLIYGELFPQDEFGGSYTHIVVDDLEIVAVGDRYQPARSIHHASERLDWETPDALFEHYNGFFKFDLDAAATIATRKVGPYFGPDHISADCRDCLIVPWNYPDGQATAWLNPPCGRQIGKFIRKAREESERGRAIVVCLVPARVDTAWWQEDAWKANEIHFIRGRVRFVGAEDQAPFPSAILIFNGNGPNLFPPVVKCVEVPRG